MNNIINLDDYRKKNSAPAEEVLEKSLVLFSHATLPSSLVVQPAQDGLVVSITPASNFGNIYRQLKQLEVQPEPIRYLNLYELGKNQRLIVLCINGQPQETTSYAILDQASRIDIDSPATYRALTIPELASYFSRPRGSERLTATNLAPMVFEAAGRLFKQR